MFDKPYLEVNREERFFCALVFHMLLSSPKFRSQVFARIDSLAGIKLNKDTFEVYFEVALMRDYWNDLGDHKYYTAEVNKRREEVIKKIVAFCKLVDLDLWKNNFMRTSNNKLWYPGKWRKNLLKGKKYESELADIIWMFNCKPDMMIISNNNIVVIDSKLESSQGRTGDGYNQYETQGKMLNLFLNLSDKYKGYKPSNITLEKEGKGLNWKEITQFARNSKDEIDTFTLKNIESLLIEREPRIAK